MLFTQFQCKQMFVGFKRVRSLCNERIDTFYVDKFQVLIFVDC